MAGSDRIARLRAARLWRVARITEVRSARGQVPQVQRRQLVAEACRAGLDQTQADLLITLVERRNRRRHLTPLSQLLAFAVTQAIIVVGVFWLLG